MRSLVSRLRSLEERLRAVEDRDAILETLHSYGHALDYGDEDLWLRCWTEDAVLGWPRREPIEGRAAILAAFRRHTHAPAKYHKHFVVDPIVRIDSDRATVESYFARLDASETETYIFAFGRYRDVLVRSPDGAWRFSERYGEMEARHPLAPV